MRGSSRPGSISCHIAGVARILSAPSVYWLAFLGSRSHLSAAILTGLWIGLLVPGILLRRVLSSSCAPPTRRSIHAAQMRGHLIRLGVTLVCLVASQVLAMHLISWVLVFFGGWHGFIAATHYGLWRRTQAS